MTKPTDITASTDLADGARATIERVEETASVDKRTVRTGRVSVRTVTEAFEEDVSADLSATKVRVERVAVGRMVDEIPQTRVEDGVTIVPVFEEVLVVERRIRLVEELHIRPETTSESVRLPVTVRRQRAVVERLPISPLGADQQNEE